MYNPALLMQKRQPRQQLLRQLLHKRHRKPMLPVVRSAYQIRQRLVHQTQMRAVRACDVEIVQEIDYVWAAGVVGMDSEGTDELEDAQLVGFLLLHLGSMRGEYLDRNMRMPPSLSSAQEMSQPFWCKEYD